MIKRLKISLFLLVLVITVSPINIFSQENVNKLIALLVNPMSAGTFGSFIQGERVVTTRALLRVVDLQISNGTYYYLVAINDYNVIQPFYIQSNRSLNLIDIQYPNTIFEDLSLYYVGTREYYLNRVPRNTFHFSLSAPESNAEIRRRNGRSLFSMEWKNDGTLNMDIIINNINLLGNRLGAAYTPYLGTFTNGGDYYTYAERNVRVTLFVSEENTISEGQIIMMFSEEEDARFAINDFNRAIGANNNNLRFNENYRTRNNRELYTGYYRDQDNKVSFSYYVDFREDSGQFAFGVRFNSLLI